MSTLDVDIKELLSKGASLYEIEEELGVSPEELVRSLLLLGGPRRIPKLDMFIYLHERGLGREEVMEIMNLTRDQYYSYRVKAIERRRYRFPRKKTRTEELLEHLKREGFLNVEDIARKFGIKKESVFQLISRARKKGLVETSGRGSTYRVFLKEE